MRAIGELQNLEELVIATFPDRSFEYLGCLRKLCYLRILHMPNISELEALSGLANIESLSLATSPEWDSYGKCTLVESLEPLAEIGALKHLELLGVCPSDRSLAPVERGKSLQSARFSQYPKTEVARFYSATRVVNQFNPEPTFQTA